MFTCFRRSICGKYQTCVSPRQGRNCADGAGMTIRMATKDAMDCRLNESISYERASRFAGIVFLILPLLLAPPSAGSTEPSQARNWNITLAKARAVNNRSKYSDSKFAPHARNGSANADTHTAIGFGHTLPAQSHQMLSYIEGNPIDLPGRISSGDSYAQASPSNQQAPASPKDQSGKLDPAPSAISLTPSEQDAKAKGINAINAGDTELAYNLLSLLAESGDPEARLGIAVILMRKLIRQRSIMKSNAGVGKLMNEKWDYLPADHKLGIKMLMDLSEQGDCTAKHLLAHLYAVGVGVPRNSKPAFPIWNTPTDDAICGVADQANECLCFASFGRRRACKACR